MSHRYTRILIAVSPHGRSCQPPIHVRYTGKHVSNTDRYTGDIRGTLPRQCPWPLLSITDTRRIPHNSPSLAAVCLATVTIGVSIPGQVLQVSPQRKPGRIAKAHAIW